MDWRIGYNTTINQLSIPSLLNELYKLENSIKHLRRSNEELKAHHETEEGDTAWVFPVVVENEQVIAKQAEQVQMVEKRILELEAETQKQATEGQGLGMPNGHLAQQTKDGMDVDDGVDQMDLDGSDNGIHL